MRKERFILKALVCLLSLPLASATDRGKLKVPDWKSINLDSYLSNNKQSTEIKSLDPSQHGRNTFHIVSKLDPSSGEKTLLMHLFDFDADGKIDLAKHFENAKVVRSEWNLDRDNKVESIKYHNKDNGEIYLKVENDGTRNIWNHYFRGELRRQEFDRNQDGKADMWYYFRSGKLYKAQATKDFNPNNIEDITKSVLK